MKTAITLMAVAALAVAAIFTPRLIGFGCREGSPIQLHDEEDEFPRCARIERF